MTLRDWQVRLLANGFHPGALDGVWGPRTEGASMAVLDALKAAQQPAPAASGPIPYEWMPDAVMERVIVHWTAGRYAASDTDRRHYHFLIEGDGNLVHGASTVRDNQRPIGARYAAHTANCNSGSIGITVCCMWEAQERPFHPGPYPMTRAQWDQLVAAAAQLCRRYALPVTPRTLLSHAEVQGTLGVVQKGKWDIARLAFDSGITGATAIGDRLRSEAIGRLLA